MAYAVVRTDNMDGTDVRAQLVSFKYMGADSTPTAIENGHVVKLAGLMDGEREIFKGVDVASDDSIKDVVLVASVELMYDERKKNLDEFINEAGTNCRGYRFHDGNFFSVTKEALSGSGEPQVGDTIELAAGTKLAFASSPSGATKVGEIVAIEDAGRYTYYVVVVK